MRIQTIFGCVYIFPTYFILITKIIYEKTNTLFYFQVKNNLFYFRFLV